MKCEIEDVDSVCNKAAKMSAYRVLVFSRVYGVYSVTTAETFCPRKFYNRVQKYVPVH